MFVPRGTNISYTQEGVTNIFSLGWGGHTFLLEAVAAIDDVDEELDVSEASFLVSEARRALKF